MNGTTGTSASLIDLVQSHTLCAKDYDYYEHFNRRYRNAFDEYIVKVPNDLRTLALAEATAKTIISYDTQSVPGLLQTPEYADGIYRMAGQVAEERIPTVVQLRTDRQAVLRRHDRPTCLFYVHEVALQQRVGDDRVMEEQYLRLLFNAHLIRIVPADAPVISSGCVLWE